MTRIYSAHYFFARCNRPDKVDKYRLSLLLWVSLQFFYAGALSSEPSSWPRDWLSAAFVTCINGDGLSSTSCRCAGVELIRKHMFTNVNDVLSDPAEVAELFDDCKGNFAQYTSTGIAQPGWSQSRFNNTVAMCSSAGLDSSVCTCAAEELAIQHPFDEFARLLEDDRFVQSVLLMCQVSINFFRGGTLVVPDSPQQPGQPDTNLKPGWSAELVNHEISRCTNDGVHSSVCECTMNRLAERYAYQEVLGGQNRLVADTSADCIEETGVAVANGRPLQSGWTVQRVNEEISACLEIGGDLFTCQCIFFEAAATLPLDKVLGENNTALNAIGRRCGQVLVLPLFLSTQASLFTQIMVNAGLFPPTIIP